MTIKTVYGRIVNRLLICDNWDCFKIGHCVADRENKTWFNILRNKKGDWEVCASFNFEKNDDES